MRSGWINITDVAMAKMGLNSYAWSKLARLELGNAYFLYFSNSNTYTARSYGDHYYAFLVLSGEEDDGFIRRLWFRCENDHGFL